MSEKNKEINLKEFAQKLKAKAASKQTTVTRKKVTNKTEQEVRLPAFFDKHPDIKARLVDYLKDIPKEQKQKSLDDYYKFINGELTWAEIRKISKRMQKELARVAYLNFKMQKYEKAETLFKGLAVIDHTNWYYRAALGAIFQKRNMFEKAVDEYTTALDLRENEITSLVNRSECYMMLKEFDASLKDLEAVIEMKLAQNNPWFMRARVLKQRVLMAKKEDKA